MYFVATELWHCHEYGPAMFILDTGHVEKVSTVYKTSRSRVNLDSVDCSMPKINWNLFLFSKVFKNVLLKFLFFQHMPKFPNKIMYLHVDKIKEMKYCFKFLFYLACLTCLTCLICITCLTSKVFIVLKTLKPINLSNWLQP